MISRSWRRPDRGGVRGPVAGHRRPDCTRADLLEVVHGSLEPAPVPVWLKAAWPG